MTMSLPSNWRTWPAHKKAEVLDLLKEKQRREQAATTKGSFREFVRHFSWEPEPAAHHELIIDKFDKVVKGEIKRLMLFLPPGSAKSTYTSLLGPAYFIANSPNKLIIGASHSGELAERFGRKVRNLVNEPEFDRLYDIKLKTDSKAAGRWECSNNAEYYAVGVRGSVTGRRGDLGLIDDPVKGRKEADSELSRTDTYEWYVSDFRTRLKPEAAQVIIQTRWHEDDLSGRILPEDYDGRSGPVMARDGEVWEVLNLPMIARENDAMGRKVGELLWPAWFTHEWVAQEQRTQGPRSWNCLFQQDPTPDDGTLFKRDEFQWYEKKPKYLRYYITGDYAVTENDGDYTEILVWGVDPQDDIHLVKAFRGQVDILEVVDRLLDFAEKYNAVASVGESGVIRRAIEPILRQRMRKRKIFVKLVWLPTTGDKVAMCAGFQGMVQMGMIYFPPKSWAEDLVKQLIKFPTGTYDDGVDACGLLGRYMDKVWKAKKPTKGEKPIKLTGSIPQKMPELKMADFMDDDE